MMLPADRAVRLTPQAEPRSRNYYWLAPTVLALAFAQLLF